MNNRAHVLAGTLISQITSQGTRSGAVSTNCNGVAVAGMRFGGGQRFGQTTCTADPSFEGSRKNWRTADRWIIARCNRIISRSHAWLQRTQHRYLQLGTQISNGQEHLRPFSGVAIGNPAAVFPVRDVWIHSPSRSRRVVAWRPVGCPWRCGAVVHSIFFLIPQEESRADFTS